MATIGLYGDPHGNITRMMDHAEKNSIDSIITVGDSGFTDKPEKFFANSRNAKNQEEYVKQRIPITIATFFEKGNHEDFEFLAAYEKNPLIPNLHYMPNGTVQEIHGIRFGILGGVYSPKYFETIKPSQQRRRHFTRKEMDLLREQKWDVLLTHEGPRTAQLQEGSEVIAQFIEETQPALAFHGHHHLPYHGLIGRTPVRGLGIIERGEEDFFYRMDTQAFVRKIAVHNFLREQSNGAVYTSFARGNPLKRIVGDDHSREADEKFIAYLESLPLDANSVVFMEGPLKTQTTYLDNLEALTQTALGEGLTNIASYVLGRGAKVIIDSPRELQERVLHSIQEQSDPQAWESYERHLGRQFTQAATKHAVAIARVGAQHATSELFREEVAVLQPSIDVYTKS